MCNLETEGTKYGCGHYQAKRTVGKIDCGNPNCSHSRTHPRSHDPANCHCERFLGPDAKEIITQHSPEYCGPCQYWFKGPGQLRR